MLSIEGLALTVENSRRNLDMICYCLELLLGLFGRLNRLCKLQSNTSYRYSAGCNAEWILNSRAKHQSRTSTHGITKHDKAAAIPQTSLGLFQCWRSTAVQLKLTAILWARPYDLHVLPYRPMGS